MGKIKLGLIGAGWVAKKHLDVIREIDGMEAVGITSRTKAKAEHLAEEYNISVCTDDIDSLVEKVSPDALLVLVSEDQMYNITASVIPYGLPLFIEKPAGINPQENWKLASLAKEYSVRNMVGFNRRYYSIFHKGIQIIQDYGLLMGVMVEGHERIWLHLDNSKYSRHILSHWVFGNSTHTIDLLRFFGGEPADIKSIAHRYKEPRGDQFAAIMELNSGAIGLYSAHWYSPGGWRIVLYGDGITVEFRPLEKGFWTDKDFKVHEIEPDEVDIRFKPGFFRQMEAFEKLVRNGITEWPMQDLEGSYRTMLLAEQITTNISDCRKNYKYVQR